MKKIMIISNSIAFYGGAFQVILNIIKECQRRKIDVTLLSHFVDNEIKEKYLNDVTLISNNKKRSGFLDFLLQLLFFIKNRALIKKHKFVIVNNFPTTFCSIFCKANFIWICNEPSVVELGLGKRNDNFIKHISKVFILYVERLLLKKNKPHLILADNFNLKRANKLYPFLESSIVPYGFDSALFDFKKRVVKDEYKFIQVGVYSREKNQLMTLESFNQILSDYPKSTLYFIGPIVDYKYYNYLVLRAKEMGISERVKFHKSLSQNIIKNMMAESHVMMHPILEQGGALAALESISSGIPLIVHEKFQMADVIDEMDLGILVNENTAVNSILDLLNNYPDYRSLRAKSVRVNKLYSWKKFSSNVLSILKKQK